jgi:hypothetical protein
MAQGLLGFGQPGQGRDFPVSLQGGGTGIERNAGDVCPTRRRGNHKDQIVNTAGWNLEIIFGASGGK